MPIPHSMPARLSAQSLALLFVLALLVCTAAAAAPVVPSSARSTKAIARVKPALERALQERGLNYGAPIFIRIFKASSELEVWLRKDERFQLFKTYPICTFSGRLGPKQRVGDLQAPEGFYRVAPAQMNPASQFHLSFNLGYPNAYDRAHGRTGSLLMVHGNCVSIGCYAMTDAGIEEIYALADAALRAGQPFFEVHAFPFRMTADSMAAQRSSEWYPFWENLKQGYDRFEEGKMPPAVAAAGKMYVFKEL